MKRSALCKQVPGLRAEQAKQVRQDLQQAENAPNASERASAFERAANAFDDLRDALPARTKPFHAVEATNGGFLWMDESGNEREHLCR